MESNLPVRSQETEQAVMDPNTTSTNEKTKRSLECAEARRLLDMYGEAVQEVLLLHDQQFHSIVEGDIAANRFDLLIHGANHRKQNAKYAYIQHLQEHGCSSVQHGSNSD